MLVDIQTAVPPFKVNQNRAAEELKLKMAYKPAIARMIDAAAAHSGIETRFVVVPDAEDSAGNKFYFDAKGPDTKIRMLEYEKWGKELTCEAVGKLFEQTKINPEEIQRLITVSCTGFFAPGLDYQLMQSYKIPFTAKRTNIGFMGCAASIIGFTSALEALKQNDVENVLLVSLEICSLHLQTEPTRDNILANTIFADGSAAVLFSKSSKINSQAKLELIDTKSILFNNSAEFMGWKIGNNGFEMILSSELPKIILETAVPSLQKIIDEWGIEKNKIKHWALHPGGRAILDALQTGLNLNDENLNPSRTVLKNFGNMSSATILFVLKEILNQNKIEKDNYCIAVAFGPGLTMEVALLKGV